MSMPISMSHICENKNAVSGSPVGRSVVAIGKFKFLLTLGGHISNEDPRSSDGFLFCSSTPVFPCAIQTPKPPNLNFSSNFQPHTQPAGRSWASIARGEQPTPETSPLIQGPALEKLKNAVSDTLTVDADSRNRAYIRFLNALYGITRAILAPILPQLALDKLINHLVEYLSRGEPSSSSEVDKLQQLEHEHEALEDANIKLKMMQGEIRSLHNRDKQNMRLIRINNKIRDVSYEIQDLEGDLEYMELQRKVEEINLQDEADNSPSERRKRRFWFPWANRQSSCHKRPRLSSSQSFKLSTGLLPL